jgi:hypothetical protein
VVDFVTSAEAKAHLRIDSDADDTWLAIWIPVVSEAVAAWLKDEWRPYELVEDSNGDVLTDSAGEPFVLEDSNGPIVRQRVKGAVLIELAQMYRFRDGSGAATVPVHWGHGYTLGAGATALLVGLRKTTIR